jgi:hypothetical protein
MGIPIYKMPQLDDIYGTRRMMDDDEQDWQEKGLYSRRHDGLYESRLERMQREWQEENSDE